jgi:hypothetical protein
VVPRNNNVTPRNNNVRPVTPRKNTQPISRPRG